MNPWDCPRWFPRLALGAFVALALMLGFLPPAAHAASPDLVISQVYGGGGNAGSVYKNDFIEILNRGSSPVNVTGWSVQYASATGSSWSVTTLSGTIPPGGYYLVQEAAGSGGTTNLPTPDASGSIAMSATTGKVALVNGTTALTGTCPGSGSYVDLLGYGTANCFETAVMAALSNTTAGLRASDGCVDTDNNSSDFASGAANPRNSASPSHSCQYLLNVAISPLAGGSVNKSPDQATYIDGSTVQLTAAPATGWHFLNWSGDATGNSNPVNVAMSGDRNVTANFEIDQHTLAVATVGSGSVAKAPDQAGYDYGSNVQLTATPASGWSFLGWSGDASGNTNPLDVTMDGNKSITATFAIDTHTLAVATVGSGSVAKAPDQASYDYGSNVQLTATPATGWHFVGWSGDASGNTNPLDVTMDADKSITATFGENTVVVSQVYGGGGNTGATWTNDFIELFNRGPDPIDVTGWTVQYASATGSSWSATPLSGVIAAGHYYLVQEATGSGGTTPLPTPDATGGIAMSATAGKVALVNGAGPLSGTCPLGPAIEDLIGYGAANCSETAPAPGLSNTTAARRHSNGCEDTDNNAADISTGAPTPRNSASPANNCLFTLTVAADPPAAGSVAKSPDQAGYADGSLVQLTATPVSGYHFDHWSGGATGSANPLTLTMDDNKSVTAHFVANALTGQVVISQVYGGGGNTGATYKNDFVELFNRGNVPVTVTGWSIQYAAHDGGPWATTTLVGTIQPGRYYLVQEAPGVGGTTNLPTPDGIGVINMGSADGKVALVNDNVVLTDDCPTGANVIDFVGYGPANCSETAPAAALDNVTASFRNHGGCDESDNNAADFSNGSPAPRNSATPIHVCDIWLDAGPVAVTEFALSPLAPNPSRGASRIPFALPVESHVRLSVMDVQGRVLANLVDGVLPAGRHEVMWNGMTNGGPARAGLYFVRFEVPGHRFARSVVLMR